MKNTRLDEDASIYAKRNENTPARKIWSTLTGREKWQFFKDYYLKIVIITGIIAAFLIWFLITILTPQPEMRMKAAFINSVMTEEAAEQLTSDLSALLNIDSKTEEVNIDNNLFMSLDQSATDQGTMTSQQKLSVYIYAGELDLIVADQAIFERFCGSGFFAPLDDALPEDLKQTLSKQYIMGQHLTEDNPEESDPEPVAYGISLSGCKAFEDLNTGIANPVLGIVINTKHPDEAIETLRYFTGS